MYETELKKVNVDVLNTKGVPRNSIRSPGVTVPLIRVYTESEWLTLFLPRDLGRSDVYVGCVSTTPVPPSCPVRGRYRGDLWRDTYLENGLVSPTSLGRNRADSFRGQYPIRRTFSSQGRVPTSVTPSCGPAVCGDG